LLAKFRDFCGGFLNDDAGKPDVVVFRGDVLPLVQEPVNKGLLFGKPGLKSVDPCLLRGKLLILSGNLSLRRPICSLSTTAGGLAEFFA
jgi:hypothetical protein